MEAINLRDKTYELVRSDDGTGFKTDVAQAAFTKLAEHTRYPADYTVTVTLHPSHPVEFNLREVKPLKTYKVDYTVAEKRTAWIEAPSMAEAKLQLGRTQDEPVLRITRAVEVS